MMDDYYLKLCTDFVESEKEKVKQFNIKPLLEDSQIEKKLRSLGIWGMKYNENILNAIINGSKFNIIIGFRPSKFHWGHLTLAREIAYYIGQGGKPIFVIAGFESNKSLLPVESEGIIENILKLVNLYSQKCLTIKEVQVIDDRVNLEIHELDVIISEKIKIRKLLQLYGWNESISIKQLRNVSITVASFLYSSYYDKSRSAIVLCDINQVTHIELTKIVARKLGLELPSFSFRLLLPSSLNRNERMSVKIPESCIVIGEEHKSIIKKLINSVTGGRNSEEEQKKFGGEPVKCCFFKYADLFLDDAGLRKVYLKCIKGDVTCSQCKNINKEAISKQFI